MPIQIPTRQTLKLRVENKQYVIKETDLGLLCQKGQIKFDWVRTLKYSELNAINEEEKFFAKAMNWMSKNTNLYKYIVPLWKTRIGMYYAYIYFLTQAEVNGLHNIWCTPPIDLTELE